MGDTISRAEYEEFGKRMATEIHRHADEDNRQNKRLDALEETVRQISTLTMSVERLATNMESMTKQMEKQWKRLDSLEVRDEVTDISQSIVRINASMDTVLKEQERQGQRLEALEAKDGEAWRSVKYYVLTALISLVLGVIAKSV